MTADHNNISNCTNIGGWWSGGLAMMILPVGGLSQTETGPSSRGGSIGNGRQGLASPTVAKLWHLWLLSVGSEYVVTYEV